MDQPNKSGSEQLGIQQGVPELSCLLKSAQATDQLDFNGLPI
jgi:hypothetical protein